MTQSAAEVAAMLGLAEDDPVVVEALEAQAIRDKEERAKLRVARTLGDHLESGAKDPFANLEAGYAPRGDAARRLGRTTPEPKPEHLGKAPKKPAPQPKKPAAKKKKKRDDGRGRRRRRRSPGPAASEDESEDDAGRGAAGAEERASATSSASAAAADGRRLVERRRGGAAAAAETRAQGQAAAEEAAPERGRGVRRRRLEELRPRAPAQDEPHRAEKDARDAQAARQGRL